MKIYSHPRCSTCRNLLKWLDERGLDYSVTDITTTPPSFEELETMLAHLDGQVRKLFNTSGQVYRELGLKDRLPTMSDSEALKLLSGNGMLIKRPFVLGKNWGLVGFKPQQYEEKLAQ